MVLRKVTDKIISRGAQKAIFKANHSIGRVAKWVTRQNSLSSRMKRLVINAGRGEENGWSATSSGRPSRPLSRQGRSSGRSSSDAGHGRGPRRTGSTWRLLRADAVRHQENPERCIVREADARFQEVEVPGVMGGTPKPIRGRGRVMGVQPT